MLKRFIGRLSALLFLGAALAGCGDSPGNTGEFATVKVTASAVTTTVSSDVNTQTTDSGTFSVTSTPYEIPPTSTGSITPSDVALTRAWVTLDPANSWTPRLPDQYRVNYFSTASPLTPGGSVTAPVPDLVTQGLKEYIKTLPVLEQGRSYVYWATASFTGVEESSDREDTITSTSIEVTFTGLQ